MRTCWELVVALLLGMLVARLISPFWPNSHVYGNRSGILVDPAGVELLDKYALLSNTTVRTVICHFTHPNNSTAQEDLPYLTKLFHVADGKHIIIIVGQYEHLALFSQVNHDDVEFIYEIKSQKELAKWSGDNISANCNVSLRITPELYQFAYDFEYPLTRFITPMGKSGDMLLLGLACPKQHFWEIEWKE